MSSKGSINTIAWFMVIAQHKGLKDNNNLKVYKKKYRDS